MTKEITIPGKSSKNYPIENLGQISMLNTSVHDYALRFGLARWVDWKRGSEPGAGYIELR